MSMPQLTSFSNLELLVIDIAIKGFVLLLLTAAMTAMLKRWSAAGLHRLWTLCFCSLIVLPVLSILMPGHLIVPIPERISWFEQTQSVMTTSALTPSDAMHGRSMNITLGEGESNPPSDDGLSGAIPSDPNIDKGREQPDLQGISSSGLPTNADLDVLAANAPAVDPASPIEVSLQHRIARWMAAIWMIGLIAVVAQQLRDHLRLRSLLRSAKPIEVPQWTDSLNSARREIGINFPVKLLQLDQSISPFIARILNPVILLPQSASDWNEPRRRFVLLHELAHAKRRDVLIQFVAHIAAAIHWFNPLVWHGLAKLRSLREHASDDLVLQLGHRPSDYATELLDLVKSSVVYSPPTAVGMARGTNIEARIYAVLDELGNRVSLTRATSRILLVAAVFVVLGMASLRFGKQIEQQAVAQDSTEQPNSNSDTTDRVNDLKDQPAVRKGKVAWLRGEGKVLEMCLKGEVVDEDGQPAKGIKVTGQLNSMMGDHPLTSVIDAHRFEIWIPVNASRWHAMNLSASTTENNSIAYLMISASELRRAVVDGVKLTLKKPTRHFSVQVLDKGQPVSEAMVKVEVGYGLELRSRSDEAGKVHFQLLDKRQPEQLMAWTDDFRVGGYSFDRGPVRDPSLNEHIVELSRCRKQKIRFVDREGAPVTGLNFRLQIATPPPNYNFIGTNEHSVLTTDANGEAIASWFPDWESHNFYPEIRDARWILDKNDDGTETIVDGVATIQLKKSKVTERKRAIGRVNVARSWAGGFYVRLRSPQGEQTSHSDMLGAFTDQDGSFAVEVLPDATYDACVDDARWVSEIIDLIPYESETDKFNSMTLQATEGQRVELTVTTGANARPYPNLSVTFLRRHMYSYHQDGKLQHTVGGPQWWVTTDENGRAVTQTLPGELRALVFEPLWRDEKKVKVEAGETVKIHLHREIDERKQVRGRVSLGEGLQMTLQKTTIKAFGFDGNSTDEKSLTCDAEGRFEFEIQAAQVGIFCITDDKKAAASVVVKNLDEPVELKLVPTIDYRGQLIRQNGEPISNHSVSAVARMDSGKKRNVDSYFSNVFNVRYVESTTDQAGNFTIANLPSGVQIMIWTKDIDDSAKTSYLEDLVLRPGESRPRKVHKLGKVSNEVD